MITLSIDTASINCAVALIKQGKVLARISETIGKGHAEKLIGQIDQVIKLAQITVSDVTRIAVNIGPGSFTGVRIGVATARALSLALKIPSIGVTSLEALGYQTLQKDAKYPVSVIFDAGRDMFYRQDFDIQMVPLSPPLLQKSEAVTASLPTPCFITGNGAKNIATQLISQYASAQDIYLVPNDMADVENYGLIGEKKQPNGAPHPLYLRDADAKPQTGFALPRKS